MQLGEQSPQGIENREGLEATVFILSTVEESAVATADRLPLRHRRW